MYAQCRMRIPEAQKPPACWGACLPGSPAPSAGPRGRGVEPPALTSHPPGGQRRQREGGGLLSATGKEGPELRWRDALSAAAAAGRTTVRRAAASAAPAAVPRSPGRPGLPRVAASGRGGETGSAGWGATGLSSPPAPRACEVLARPWASKGTAAAPRTQKGTKSPGPTSSTPGHIPPRSWPREARRPAHGQGVGGTGPS